MSEMLPPPDVRLMNATAAVLLALTLGLAFVLAANWGLRHPAFALKRIAVDGDVSHNNAITLRANVAPRLAGNFFTVDLQAARSAFESVPWVRHAVVRRDFPNRLRVTLEEHRAAAFWGADGESRLLNTHGEVFEANPGDIESDDLPRLQGPEGQSALVLRTYEALVPLFGAQDALLAQLELTGRGNWRAVLDGGAQIELGRGEIAELTARLRRFLATWTQVASRYGRGSLDQVESADLRHANGYALKLRGVTTLADATKK